MRDGDEILVFLHLTSLSLSLPHSLPFFFSPSSSLSISISPFISHFLPPPPLLSLLQFYFFSIFASFSISFSITHSFPSSPFLSSFIIFVFFFSNFLSEVVMPKWLWAKARRFIALWRRRPRVFKIVEVCAFLHML